MADLCVEFMYMWVRGGRRAKSVFFDNESFRDFDEVRNVTLRDVVFCVGVRILRNWGSPVLQEDGNLSRAKDSPASRAYESQSTCFRLVKIYDRDVLGCSFGNKLPSRTIIRRW